MSDGVQQDELSPETLALAEKGQQGLSDVPTPASPASEAKPARPDNIPEKFWDADKGQVRTDALLASYSELEKKFSAPKGEENDANQPPENDTARIKPSVETNEGSDGGEGAGEEAPAPAAALTDAIAEAQQVYAETGELTEDTIAKLAEAGIPENVVALYVEGIKAQEKALAASAYAAAGGEEQYKAAVAWAAKNWDADQVSAYDQAIGNPKLIAVTVGGLMAAYKDAVGDEGSLLEITGGVGSGDTYTNMSEFHKDLRAADDAGDVAARQKAVQKLERSKKAGSITSQRKPGYFGGMG